MKNSAANKLKQVPAGYLGIGIDPHKKKHAAVAITKDFTTHAKFKFDNSRVGLEMMLQRARVEMVKTGCCGVIFAIETGKLNLDGVVIRIRDLRQRQEQHQARRIEIESQISDRKVELADLETVSCYVDDLHNLLKEGTLAERRAFIRSFVKEVKITGNEAVLTYTIPMLPEKVTIEKEGVLPTVQDGGRYWT